MAAFNQRLEPQYIMNLLPVLSALSLLMLLVSGLLAFLMPFLLLKLLFGLVAIASLVLAIVGFVQGRELPFIFYKLDGNRDASASGNLTIERQ